MAKLTLIGLLGLLSVLNLTLAFEPGTQYLYRYVGRVTTGIRKIKDENAAMQVECRVAFQSVDHETVIIQLRDIRIRRNGQFNANPYHAETIGGVEDSVPDEQFLGAPFVVHHKMGSFVDVEINAHEPDWVVNFKKGIASQIQLDLASVRPDGPAADLKAVFSEGHSATFDVFEDSVTGDCSTTIRVNRLTGSQTFETDAFKLGSFDAVCEGKPVYEIIKSKHYDNCKTYPVFYSAYPATYDCTPGRPNCGEYMQRTSTTRFIACGESLAKLTFVHASSFSNLAPSPFGTKSEKLVALSITDWALETREPISSRLTAPANPTVHKSLAYVFDDFQQRDECGKPVQPSLTDAYIKKPSVESHTIKKLILDGLRIVARDLIEQPDARRDNLERLATIGRAIPMLSLDDLRSLWQQVKDDDYVVITLFVDTVVQSGSNPAIMLIKELIENREITETKAAWALAAIGYYAKTPTRALLHELINLVKSNVVQSSKTLRQTASMTVADLLGSACASPHLAIKRFPIALLGDFCDAKDDVVVDEFLPMLVEELESSESGADRIVALGSIGSLGVEEIIPVLLPFIRGTGNDGNTAERVRAIMSLFRVASAAPERVHHIAAAVAGNVNERPEVRMTALSLLFNSDAPLCQWQKFAASTWLDPSQQVVSFTNTLLRSFGNLPAGNAAFAGWREKARQALPMAKPAPFGAPYSFMDIRSSYMEDDDFGIYMATPQFRVADEHWPVLIVNRYFYHFGPFATDSLSAYLWNYNMDDVWNGIVEKMYGKTPDRASSSGKARGNVDFLRNIWQVLKATSRPADKRAGLLHINLLGSINRAFNLENLDQLIPTLLTKLMRPNEPLQVSVTKFRLLSEFIVRLPNELGLPMRYYFGVPVLVSLQGAVRGDGSGFKSQVAAELSRKLTSELRVELPASGYYIATGADNVLAVRAPKEVRVRYERAQVRVLWAPAETAADLVYLHTKPYTITRHLSQSYVPFMEDESVRIVEKAAAKKRSFDVGSQLGVGLQFSSLVDDEFADKVTFYDWLSKWDVNSISNLPSVPLSIRHRVFVLRFDPAETQVRSVQLNFKYQYVTKASPNTIAYESGSTRPSKLNKAEISSAYPIATEFKQALDRLLENLESGNAHLLACSIQSQRTDGTAKYLVSNLGLAKDAWYTKDFTDWNVQSYTTSASGKKDVDWAVCYRAARDWNKPPTFGFSNNVLYLNDEERISFGEHCNESSIHFKARVYRDDEAARVAMESPAGVECRRDMTTGFQYGSPACSKARRMDHTYNVYEMSVQTEDPLPGPVSRFAYQVNKQLNYLLHPFITEHLVGQQNPAGSASWVVKLDPLTGSSDMEFVRPHETVVAEKVRVNPKWKPFSPLGYAYSRVFYPLNAETNFIRDAAALTSGGVSQAKCYVGSQGVHTYDGAYYNYTVDGCHHVLLTDCSNKSEFAVLGRTAKEGHKVVTAIIGKDSIELDPSGKVFVNGDRVLVDGFDKEARVELRGERKNILAVVYPKPEEGSLILEVRTLYLFVKVQNDHVTISAPYTLRGRLCGLCGDYNQELSAEFKTPERCAVSNGALMAASFKLSSGDECSSLYDDEIVKRLEEETSDCRSVDTYLPTQIKEVDPTASTRCVRRQKLVIERTYAQQGHCESEEEYAACQPGCKPVAQLTKPVRFKCQGSLSDFVSLVSVPTTCVSV